MAVSAVLHRNNNLHNPRKLLLLPMREVARHILLAMGRHQVIGLHLLHRNIFSLYISRNTIWYCG